MRKISVILMIGMLSVSLFGCDKTENNKESKPAETTLQSADEETAVQDETTDEAEYVTEEENDFFEYESEIKSYTTYTNEIKYDEKYGWGSEFEGYTGNIREISIVIEVPTQICSRATAKLVNADESEIEEGKFLENLASAIPRDSSEVSYLFLKVATKADTKLSDYKIQIFDAYDANATFTREIDISNVQKLSDSLEKALIEIDGKHYYFADKGFSASGSVDNKNDKYNYEKVLYSYMPVDCSFTDFPSEGFSVKYDEVEEAVKKYIECEAKYYIDVPEAVDVYEALGQNIITPSVQVVIKYDINKMKKEFGEDKANSKIYGIFSKLKLYYNGMIISDKPEAFY